jgi:hypothetical protein
MAAGLSGMNITGMTVVTAGTTGRFISTVGDGLAGKVVLARSEKGRTIAVCPFRFNRRVVRWTGFGE